MQKDMHRRKVGTQGHAGSYARQTACQQETKKGQGGGMSSVTKGLALSIRLHTVPPPPAPDNSPELSAPHPIWQVWPLLLALPPQGQGP